MQRVKFTGPEGHRLVGTTLRLITDINSARLSTLIVLKDETGLSAEEAGDRAKEDPAFSVALAIFLSLRNAGQFVTFTEVADTFGIEDLDVTGIEPAAEVAEPTDPTSAPTASGPVAVEGKPAPGSHRKPAKTSRKPSPAGS